MKKIDVIIPAYHAHDSIIKTLGSILIQSIKDQISVTIVNDADEKDYSSIVDIFKSYLDIQEIKLKENGGPGVARQYGIDNTSAPYFTCIDADDTFAGSFALEILITKLEEEEGYHTCIGTFLEQRENLEFAAHPNDMIWMFGKLYKRSFIKQYNIRFNDTRANEDNGFNTLIRLCSSEQEKVKFIPDIVYFWHYKADSITRINDAEYSYNQSFPGYTDNMIYAIKEARKRKPFNNYIDIWSIQVMANLYNYYLQTMKRDARFTDQNYTYCIKYYNEIYSDIEKRIPEEHQDAIVAQSLVEQAHGMPDILPSITFRDFIKDISTVKEILIAEIEE